ncbi:MAG: aspartate aminotransferase family protein, partial [Haloechinothrix sp.]
LWTTLPEDRADEASGLLLERLNDSGAMYLSHTTVDGRMLLRMAIGAPATRHEHVLTAWQRIRSEYRALCVELGSA